MRYFKRTKGKIDGFMTTSFGAWSELLPDNNSEVIAFDNPVEDPVLKIPEDLTGPEYELYLKGGKYLDITREAEFMTKKPKRS